MSIETRDYPILETRVQETEGKGTVMSGHAAVFNAQSLLLPPERDGPPRPFHEEIAPGAFRNSLETRNIFCLVNHDNGKVLGSTQSGTLTLQEDETGLRYVLQLPNTSFGNDLRESCRRGDLSTCSFGFTVEKQSVREGENGRPLRRLEQVALSEISLGVASPAYTATTMEVRCVQEFLQDQERASKLTRYRKIIEIMSL